MPEFSNKKTGYFWPIFLAAIFFGFFFAADVSACCHDGSGHQVGHRQDSGQFFDVKDLNATEDRLFEERMERNFAISAADRLDKEAIRKLFSRDRLSIEEFRPKFRVAYLL